MPGLTDQVKRGTGIGEFIREQREQAQVSVRQLARLAGVSNPYLSQIERGLRKPSAEILQQIAKGLRISAEQLYVQAGFLDAPDVEPRGDRHVIAAIMADPHLAERQKQVLVDVYLALYRENGDPTGAEVEVLVHPALPADPAGSPGTTTSVTAELPVTGTEKE